MAVIHFSVELTLRPFEAEFSIRKINKNISSPSNCHVPSEFDSFSNHKINICFAPTFDESFLFSLVYFGRCSVFKCSRFQANDFYDLLFKQIKRPNEGHSFDFFAVDKNISLQRLENWYLR